MHITIILHSINSIMYFALQLNLIRRMFIFLSYYYFHKFKFKKKKTLYMMIGC